MSHLVSMMLVIIMNIISITSSCDGIETETLCVNQVSRSGFGDRMNQYPLSMVTFKGSVYIATLNAKNAPIAIAAFFLGLPFKTKGTQIYKGDMVDSEWVWTPVVLNDLNYGLDLNYGVRNFAVIGDYLYGVTGNHVEGFEIWRTFDGETWEIIMTGGFGDCSNLSARGLIAFKGYLYVGVENRKTGAKIFRRQIEENGVFTAGSDWEEVIDDGFGTKHNYWISDFVTFRDYLYAGTLNPFGMQLWRTLDGVTWTNVFKNGNGFIGNTAAMTLYHFESKLYIGTMNFFKGASLWVNTDFDGTSFDTVFTEGFGNRFNFYIWSMQEFTINGINRLYIGTWDPIKDGFDLFSSQAPGEGTWNIETRNAFGFNRYYGARSMTVIDDKLMIGAATASTLRGCIIFEATANTANINIHNETKINIYDDDEKMVKDNYNDYNQTDFDIIKQMVCKDMDITLKEMDVVKQFCG